MNKGVTDRAAKIDAEAAAARRKLEKTPPVAAVNPMAETLARIFHIEADSAATWQQVATVIVVELLIAFALIAYELLGTRRHPVIAAAEVTPEAAAAEVKEATPAATSFATRDMDSEHAEVAALPAVEPAAIAILRPPRPRPSRKAVTASKADRRSGDVAKFAVACLRPSVGASVAIPALYQPYIRWCEQQGFHAVPREKFEGLFSALCDLSGFIRSDEAGESRCLNLELAA